MNSVNNYYVYMHKSPNGKVYVGITCQEPTKRWNNGKGYQHNEYFSRAIEKYGWDNFEHIIIAYNVGIGTAKEVEKDFIKFYDSTNPDKGYNITHGGEANWKGGNAKTMKQKNAEKYQRHRQQYLDNKKEYYQSHKQERDSYTKQYNQEHREELNAYYREYYKKHKTEISIRRKELRNAK